MATISKLDNVNVRTVETPKGFVATVFRDGVERYSSGLVYPTRDKARREALKDFQDLYSWGMIDTSMD